MRVALICGSWPPAQCGVADYSRQLALHLAREKIDVVEIEPRLARYRKLPTFDVAHIQYPASGYGKYSLSILLPFRLAPRRVVTMHEYSIFSWKRKASIFPTRLMDARIFSSDFEQQTYARETRQRLGTDLVIPIGSNIPKAPDVPRDLSSVCYFGLIMPGKGLEEFLELAALLGPVQGFRLSLIGAVPAHWAEYARNIIEKARDLKVEIYSDLTPEAAARVLAEHNLAYLPFPDGASEKRGSLIACMANGNIAVTTYGKFTPEWMRDATVEARTPAEAAMLCRQLREEQDRSDGLRRNAKNSAAFFDWQGIAARHVELYKKLVGGSSASARAAADERGT